MFVLLTVLVLAGLAGPLLSFGARGLVPAVIGELIAGFVLGRTGFGVIDPSLQPLPAFSALGFAMLMLSAGTHVDIGSPAIRQGLIRGLLAFVIVALCAVPLGFGIDRALGINHPALLAVLIAGSSAAVAFPILAERGLTGPHLALLVAWIALADSATVVVMPLTLTQPHDIAIAIAGDVAIVAGGALVLAAALRARRERVVGDLRAQSLTRGWAWQLRISLLLLLGLSATAERTGASTLVAGFLAGMIIVRLREPDRLALQITGVANGFFVPLFFVLLGAQINLRALVESPSRIVLAVALACAAVIAHVVAARFSARERRVATGLTASAQLGMPAAAASLGLATHALSAADAAALVAAGCLTLIPATVGSLLLTRDLARANPPKAAGQTAG
ncbi:MAG: cation:proton antiporter [Candidatus Dormibacteraeota bacterium]|nr:cation:proton antiporter [Candidatus Dormibacteraeota bacterium]